MPDVLDRALACLDKQRLIISDKELKMTIDCNRTHYLKWKLDLEGEELSIRYHFLWQDKKELEGKYILKHHSRSTHSEISEKMAKMFIKHNCTAKEEVIAYLDTQMIDSEMVRTHRKTVITDKHIRTFIGGREDVMTNEMKHKFKDQK